MGPRIGIIAGAGQFPLRALEMAKTRGYTCVVAGIRGETLPELKLRADAFEWFGREDMVKLLAFFKSQDVGETVLVGKVEPRILFQKESQDEALSRILARAKDRRPTSVLNSFIGFLASQGIAVKDPGFLLEPYFCPEGVLTRSPLSPQILEEIEFGWAQAKVVADLDIGQTVIVKDKAIVAVEALDGTDETIARAGRLAGEAVVAIKVGRTDQDMRIDVPAVGLETLKSLAKVRAAALVFEAFKVLFFEKEEALALAEANKIAVVARSEGSPYG